jgi:NAD(P)-dependent dehydrogenase (short-subunit alcohol dehydrogenase family)
VGTDNQPLERVCARQQRSSELEHRQCRPPRVHEDACDRVGELGITANAVAPGFVATEMTRATAHRVGVPWEEFKERAAGKIPVGRAGEPADVANVVAFFASEESGFVSGQVIYVAGGPRA